MCDAHPTLLFHVAHQIGVRCTPYFHAAPRDGGQCPPYVSAPMENASLLAEILGDERRRRVAAPILRIFGYMRIYAGPDIAVERGIRPIDGLIHMPVEIALIAYPSSQNRRCHKSVRSGFGRIAPEGQPPGTGGCQRVLSRCLALDGLIHSARSNISRACLENPALINPHRLE